MFEKSSKRSSNRPFQKSLEVKRVSKSCDQSEAATELYEFHLKESAFNDIALFGCSKPILLLSAKNEYTLFFYSRDWRANENLGCSAKRKAR